MASSWGEDLLRYKQEKLRTPWDVKGGPSQHPRVKWSELAQKHRAFNPLLQRPIKTAAARRLESQEAQRKQQAAQRAIEKRLANTYIHYDPVSNETRYPSKIPPPKKEHIIADTRTDYNILNFNQHFNKDRWHQFTKAKREDLGKKTDFPAELTYAKEFDIVSTKYKSGHDERVSEEQRRLLQEKQEEFRRRNKYNAVRGVFYDKSKEIAFRQRRKEFMEAHSQAYDPPEHLRGADGALYDIVSMEVRDPEGLARKEALDNRSLEGKKKKTIFEQMVKERQSKEYVRCCVRQLHLASCLHCVHCACTSSIHHPRIVPECLCFSSPP